MATNDKSESLEQEEEEVELQQAGDEGEDLAGEPTTQSIPVEYNDEDYEDVRQLPCTD